NRGPLVTTTAATTAAPAWTGFLRLGLIHSERATIHHFTAQAANGRLGFLIGPHLHEPKSLRPAGIPVGDELGRLDSTEGGEHLTNLRRGRIERQVPDIQLLPHDSYSRAVHRPLVEKPIK